MLNIHSDTKVVILEGAKVTMRCHNYSVKRLFIERINLLSFVRFAEFLDNVLKIDNKKIFWRMQGILGDYGKNGVKLLYFRGYGVKDS
jgi:hypothetical protein